MTREETKKILMIIDATYPNYRPADITFAIDTWTTFLSSYSYSDVENALKAFVLTDTSGFAPSIGQLISMIDLKAGMKELTEMQAWSLVRKALCNGTYGAEEEFDKLPETVQRAVGNPDNLRGWAQMDIKSVENVAQSNFLRAYRAELKKIKLVRKMPDNLKQDLLGEDDIKLLNG